MSKPETTFYTSVHKHLPPPSELHREKMNNPYRGGTADHWYSGKLDLWVEWKFLVLPKKSIGVKDIDLVGGKDPIISALQQDWIESRCEEGRDVWVIVGFKEGGVIMSEPGEWKRQWSVSQLRAECMGRYDLARQIDMFTRGV